MACAPPRRTYCCAKSLRVASTLGSGVTFAAPRSITTSAGSPSSARRTAHTIEIGDVGVGHEELGAGERPTAGLGARNGRHAFEIPARARFEKRERREPAAVADAGQPAPRCAVVAGMHQRATADDRAEERSGHRDAPHLAEHDGELEHAEAGATVLFGEDQAQPAEHRQLPPCRVGGAARVRHHRAHVAHRRDRRQHVACGALQERLLGSEREVHGLVLRAPAKPVKAAPWPTASSAESASGEARADRVYEDEHAVAFRDINPAGPTHILVIPRQHIATLADLTPEDDALMGHLHRVAVEVARADGRRDFRVAVNCGAGAGQSVFHLHLHVIGGRALAWPPG